MNVSLADFQFNDLAYFLLWFHCLMGGIAALIAKQKGYSYGRWLVIGLIGGTVAFVYVLWLKKKGHL